VAYAWITESMDEDERDEFETSLLIGSDRAKRIDRWLKEA